MSKMTQRPIALKELGVGGTGSSRLGQGEAGGLVYPETDKGPVSVSKMGGIRGSSSPRPSSAAV